MNKKLIVIATGFILLGLLTVAVGFNDSNNESRDFLKVIESSGEIPRYDFSEADKHIGEEAYVAGVVKKVFVSKKGTVFFNFCLSSRCPFSAVIFASDAPNFGNVMQYERDVTIRGIIRAYKGSSEIILNSPDQIE